MKVPSRLSRPESPKPARRPGGGDKAGSRPTPEAKAAAQAEAVRHLQGAADANGAGSGGGGGEAEVHPDAEANADPLWGGARTAAKGPGTGRSGMSDPRSLPQSMSPRDAFAAQAALAKAASARQVRETLGGEVSQALPPSRTEGTDPFSALNRAQPPGIYFKEDEDGGHGHRGPDEEELDPELEEALEEALQLLFGVAGIHRVSPGRDDGGAPVVLIFATRGFGAASMERVPEVVRGFRTLLVVPYELLPLRRRI